MGCGMETKTKTEEILKLADAIVEHWKECGLTREEILEEFKAMLIGNGCDKDKIIQSININAADNH